MNSLPDIEGFLCSILRGDFPAWPFAESEDFEREFLDRSAHHGVLALLFDLVENADAWEEWPDRVRAELRDASRAGAAVDMLRSHALREVLAAFGNRDIPVLITKGGALAHSVYGHSRLRTRVDTDLFIGIEHIERARETMVSIGFEVVPPIYKSHQFVCVQTLNGLRLDFDLHWRILNAPQFARVISFEEAWERSVSLPKLAGGRTLCPVDALLLACLHRKGSEFHDEDRLIWLYDIHLLASSFSVESWSGFEGQVVARGVQAPCLDGLLKSRECLSTQIPTGLLVALEASRPSLGKFASSNLALLIDDLRCLPGWTEKRGLIRELFVPSAGSLMEKYHKTNRAWLPLLYARQVLGGFAKRLLLQ